MRSSELRSMGRPEAAAAVATCSAVSVSSARRSRALTAPSRRTTPGATARSLRPSRRTGPRVSSRSRRQRVAGDPGDLHAPPSRGRRAACRRRRRRAWPRRRPGPGGAARPSGHPSRGGARTRASSSRRRADASTSGSRAWRTPSAASCSMPVAPDAPLPLPLPIATPAHPSASQVAQAAGTVLEVGLEHLRHRSGAVGARGRIRREAIDDLRLAPPREATGAVEGALRARAVAGDEAQIDEAGEDVDLGGRERERLLRRADRVTEDEAGVPERVPQLLGGSGDRAAGRAPAVQEHEVEVGAGTQLAARVRTERDDREPPDVREAADDVAARRVERVRERGTVRLALQARVGVDPGPCRSERSGGRGSVSRGRPGLPRRCGCGTPPRPGPPTPSRHRSCRCERSRRACS